MNIAVFGMGYVGAVTAALLAEQGNSVVGIDTNPAKVEILRAGSSPVIEPRLGEIIAAAVKSKKLTTSTDPAAATGWKMAFICVGTPSGAGGQVDSYALEKVIAQLGKQINHRQDYPVIAIRSTVAPQILQNVVLATLKECCGELPGQNYGLVVIPEFLREGSSVEDFYNPPFTLIGESSKTAGDIAEELFGFLSAPVVRLNMGEAVMVKYASNAFHALKVAFANEIGLFCAHEGLNSHSVMEAFCRDTKLNISPSYLKPGFAFGGSCLPKDVRALSHRARQVNLETPIIQAILPSNRFHLDRCINTVLASGKKNIGILGVSFKPGTDDLRESPMIVLIEALIGKGKSVSIFDSNVNLARLTGTNREFIERTIPHIASLLKSDLNEVIETSEALVVGNWDPMLGNLSDLKSNDQIIIDFSKPSLNEEMDSSPRIHGLSEAVINA